MTTRPKIAAVSDVCIGYGSPQIQAFARSLAEFYSAEPVIIEPDVAKTPPRHGDFPDITIHRKGTGTNPYTPVGRTHYIIEAAKELNSIRPEIVVVFCTFCVPVLFKLKYRPKLVIYYSIEMIAFYGQEDVRMNRALGNLVDILIFPEENRAALDIYRCGLQGKPVIVLYNCSNRETNGTVAAPNRRNGRFINAGSISSEKTFANYYLAPEVQGVPIDLFGNISGEDKTELAESLNNLHGEISYRGFVHSQSLARLRLDYCFSIVMWNPSEEGFLYAASNKLFEAIADGVPPITAPHPQHKMLVERYDCGIVMRDWTFDSFHEALAQAMALRDTDRYSEMVENCRRATRLELNWDSQFEKVKPYIAAIADPERQLRAVT